MSSRPAQRSAAPTATAQPSANTAPPFPGSDFPYDEAFAKKAKTPKPSARN